MGINTFISQFKGGARPNRYRVAFTWPGLVGSPNVRDEIFISAAGLPASTVGMIQVPYMGRQIPVPGDRTFEDWTVTVINDTSFSHRNAFERWSNLIVSHESNIQGAPDYRSLVTTADVVQLDRDDKIIKSIKFFNLFPTNISQIDLGMDQNDSLELYTVTFSFSHWGSANTPTT